MDTQVQREKAQAFKLLHLKGNPLMLCNIWDAGSAKTIQAGGAKAIATSSWSVAASHGYEDGEKLPFDLVLSNLKRIIANVDLPAKKQLTEFGVARISYGPPPYNWAMKVLPAAIGLIND